MIHGTQVTCIPCIDPRKDNLMSGKGSQAPAPLISHAPTLSEKCSQLATASHAFHSLTQSTLGRTIYHCVGRVDNLHSLQTWSGFSPTTVPDNNFHPRWSQKCLLGCLLNVCGKPQQNYQSQPH